MSKKIIAALGLLVWCQIALAQLILSPTRIVFDKNLRAAQLDLVNNGPQPATYRISLVNRRMNEVGDFSPADTALPGENFVDDLVRFSPRQVTIEPGSSQVIRLSLRKPADLPEGEYRSHLLLERIADVDMQNSIDAQAKSNEKEIGIQLVALIGASIPVIVRNGDLKVEMEMSAVAYRPSEGKQQATISLTLKRSGNRSSFGDIVAIFTPNGGNPREVLRAGGMSVYVPNLQRNIRLPIDGVGDQALANGKLQVTYQLRPEEGKTIMAEASLSLP